jgi:SAM-dependent methyltransferase
MKSTNVRHGLQLPGPRGNRRIELYVNNVEYVVLRLIRRFLLPADLHRWGRYVPFYRTNLAETEPDRICQRYIETLALAQRDVVGKRIVEVGSGATNSAGYALACAGAAEVFCIEPFVEFNAGEDFILLEQLVRLHGRNPAEVSAAVTRCDSFDRVEPASADLIVSHSVLEHVRDLAPLLTKMRAALAPTGAMLHIVDYRDHFFKYPLHFLQFSERTWTREIYRGGGSVTIKRRSSSRNFMCRFCCRKRMSENSIESNHEFRLISISRTQLSVCCMPRSIASTRIDAMIKSWCRSARCSAMPCDLVR